MKEKNKLSLKQIVVIGIFTGLGTVGGKFAFNYFTTGSIGDQVKIEKVLMQVANEMNQNLPLVLDQHTRLDTTIASAGNKFVYQYTMLNIDPSALNKEQFIQTMRPRLINQYETKEDMKTFRDMDVELAYSYLSEEGNEIVRITISPDDFTKQ
jgi:hypothetical protein